MPANISQHQSPVKSYSNTAENECPEEMERGWGKEGESLLKELHCHLERICTSQFSEREVVSQNISIVMLEEVGTPLRFTVSIFF